MSYGKIEKTCKSRFVNIVVKFESFDVQEGNNATDKPL